MFFELYHDTRTPVIGPPPKMSISPKKSNGGPGRATEAPAAKPLFASKEELLREKVVAAQREAAIEKVKVKELIASNRIPMVVFGKGQL